MISWWHKLLCYLGHHQEVVVIEAVRLPRKRKKYLIRVVKCSRCSLVLKAAPLGSCD